MHAHMKFKELHSTQVIFAPLDLKNLSGKVRLQIANRVLPELPAIADVPPGSSSSLPALTDLTPGAELSIPSHIPKKDRETVASLLACIKLHTQDAVNPEEEVNKILK